ncbi:MAG: system potassium uptake protein [Solirubrobacteraceae bacterium]|nr:system potassium uptake protein [Solirubrobacteraceae bacterium]
MSPEPASTPAKEPEPEARELKRAQAHAGVAALTLGALGVVFGDIGTSPLYAMKEVFAGVHPLTPDRGSVYGVLSLIFWAITIIVSVKYVSLIMRADNHGEGGIMALISLIQDVVRGMGRFKYPLIMLGAFGAALFYGDGMITPAISVLSAVEGLKVVAPGLASYVVPITLVILTSLFAIQRFGTALVGRVFGPVMAVWFAALAVTGLVEILKAPGILRALSPTYGISFFVHHGGEAFLALGSVVLAVTGAEALYADMGHFGRPAIRRSWFFAVMPALVLNYFGQGANLLSDPRTVDSPFYKLVPSWGQVPMLLLATFATVIASQAVISGAFSVTRQAVQLGFLPRLNIRHTSHDAIGQVFVPAVNGVLYVGIVALVVGFGSSTKLASAYGIAVTGTLAIDTVLFFVVVRTLWNRPLKVVIPAAAFFLIVDLAFFTANLTKVLHGGWFPLSIGLVVFTLLMTWRRGRETVSANRLEVEGPLQPFVDYLNTCDDPPVRVPGTAVFMSANRDTTPLALRYNVEHNRVLHEHVVIVTLETASVPYVPADERIEIDDLKYSDDGIALVCTRYGFMDDVDVPASLRGAEKKGLPIDVDEASYFLSRITIDPRRGTGMAMWRKKIFVGLSRNAASPVGYFKLPDDRVISLGSSIEL